VEWVQDHLSVRVKNIRDIDELNRHWLQDESSANHTASASSSPSANNENVNVLLLTHLINPPLFLAALSIKFTGRIKFGMFSIKKEDSDALRKKLKMLDLRIPSYVIITPERTVVYGRRRSEHFNFASMNLFLRTVHPEMNDVFLCSLLLVNMLVILQIFQVMAYNVISMKRVCTVYIIAHADNVLKEMRLNSAFFRNFLISFYALFVCIAFNKCVSTSLEELG
jgi:E3 ubiquitin-protein ligase RNF103